MSGESGGTRRGLDRRNSVRGDDLGWEDKVMQRLKGRIDRLANSDRGASDLGWEAAGFEVLRSHAELPDIP